MIDKEKELYLRHLLGDSVYSSLEVAIDGDYLRDEYRKFEPFTEFSRICGHCDATTGEGDCEYCGRPTNLVGQINQDQFGKQYIKKVYLKNQNQIQL